MRYFKTICRVAMATMALTAVAGAGSASATELYKSTNQVTQGTGTAIEGSLKSGSSLLLQRTTGIFIDTCTGSELATKVESPGGEGAHPSGKVSALTFTGCSHETAVVTKGSLEVKHIAGTTNGTVTSSGLEVEVESTEFGVTLSCKTGSGTDIGTLTGVDSVTHATLDIDAVLDCGGFVPTARLTGTYTITTPTGLNVEAAPKSGTELYKFTNQVTQGTGTVIEGSLKSGSSLLLQRTTGIFIDTCTGSELATKVESPGGEGAHPSGKVSTLTFTGCSHETEVVAKGSLEVKHIAGTTNGTVTSSGLEVEVESTTFGANLPCTTGAGTDIGTLTGADSVTHATLDIDAVLNCGSLVSSARLTGTYTITTPTGLNVEAK